MRTGQIDVQKKWNEATKEERTQLLFRVGFAHTAAAVGTEMNWTQLPKWLRKLLSKEMTNGRSAR